MPVNNPAPAIRPPRARDELSSQPWSEEQYSSAPPAAPAEMNRRAEDLGVSDMNSAAAPEQMERTATQAGVGGVSNAAPPAPTSGVTADLMASSGVPGSSYGGATPAGGSGLNANLTGFAQESLNAGGRYDLPMVQQAMALIDAELGRGRSRAMSGLDEQMSQRGLAGSTFEGQLQGDLEANLELERSRYAQDFRDKIAQTTMQDRKTAADIGTQVGQFGLDQQAVDLRAQELMQQAQLEGRSLDIQEARLAAENEQFYANLGQRQSEFAANMGLARDQFAFEQRQFSATHAEQIASRLQQESQFARSLDSEDARFAMQMGLETRALDLQEQGMSQDEAFRRAQLDLERDIETRSLELQEQGMAQDEAYRRAALESENDRFRQGLEFEREQWTDTSNLSRLDIILRALASGKVDPATLKQYLGGGGEEYTGQGTTQTGGGEGGLGNMDMILRMLQGMGG